ncbi:MAG: ATP phosphoribosyltransferase regulatory subunit [Microcoleaceae cyanobacterium]
MVHQTPLGARDLLPPDVVQKFWIESRLQETFHRWGYQRIITSTLERIDTLTAGGAVQRSSVIQLQDANDEAMGLRPELTVSIARTAVTRMTGEYYWPQRFCYIANVFRKGRQVSYGGQLESYQAGVELLGAGGLLADAEVILLLLECLNILGLNDAHLILGDAGLTQSLLSTFPEDIREQVREAIAHLDRISLKALPLSPELQELALLLFDLRGEPESVLQQMSQLNLEPDQRQVLDNLKSLINLLQGYWENPARQSSQTTPLKIVLDLSLIQTFDYYTGVVFDLVRDSGTGVRILGQGGRYDQLLGLYHPQGKTEPGIGFGLNIEEIHQQLLTTGQLPKQTPASDWLVVPQTPEAYGVALAYAEKLRASTHAVQVELELRIDGGAAAVQGYARSRGISQIAWIDMDGVPKVEKIKWVTE